MVLTVATADSHACPGRGVGGSRAAIAEVIAPAMSHRERRRPRPSSPARERCVAPELRLRTRKPCLQFSQLPLEMRNLRRRLCAQPLVLLPLHPYHFAQTCLWERERHYRERSAARRSLGASRFAAPSLNVFSASFNTCTLYRSRASRASAALGIGERAMRLHAKQSARTALALLLVRLARLRNLRSYSIVASLHSTPCNHLQARTP